MIITHLTLLIHECGVDRYKEAWWPKDENFEGFSFLRNDSYGYTEEDVAKDWTKSIVTMGAYWYSAYSSKKSFLIAWIGGSAVRFMESLSDDKIMTDLVAFMNQYLSKEYPNLTPPEEIIVMLYNI